MLRPCAQLFCWWILDFWLVRRLADDWDSADWCPDGCWLVWAEAVSSVVSPIALQCAAFAGDLSDPLQPLECIFRDIAGVDDTHHIAAGEHRRFLDMMLGEDVADLAQIVRHIHRDDRLTGDVPDFAVHQIAELFIKIHGHERRRIHVERMLCGEESQDIPVGNKADQRLAAIDYGNAADALFCQQLQHSGQAGVAVYRVNVLLYQLRQRRALCRRRRGRFAGGLCRIRRSIRRRFRMNAEDAVASRTEDPRDDFQAHAHQDRGDDRAQAHAPQGVDQHQAGDQRDGDHADVEDQLDGGKRFFRDFGNGQHRALAGQRNQVHRHVEEDPDGDEHGADDHHEQLDVEVSRVGQERHQVVGKCRQVAEQDADGYLQQVFQLERAP